MMGIARRNVEMDERVTIRDQLGDTGGPVILVNKFTVRPEETDQLLVAWANDAIWMKRQPGFISTQLHRGIAGSGVFLNYAVCRRRTSARRSPIPSFRVNSPNTHRAPSPHLTCSARQRSRASACLERRAPSFRSKA